jgi:predicted Zn-dependent protease with MMP-like domain
MGAPSGAEIEGTLDRGWELLDEGDARGAVALVKQLLGRGVSDPDDLADLRHLLGGAYDELGDRRAAVREWLEVRRLDAAGDDDTLALGSAEFERVVDDALGELPPELLARLSNVAILADDRPSEEMVRDGVDPRLLGLFHGLAMPHESTLGPGYPDAIHLFQRNLERSSDDEAELRELIRVTVLHETAHYIGLDEDDLERLGLG